MALLSQAQSMQQGCGPGGMDAAERALTRQLVSAQMQYAQWEEGQKDFRRARSVWERALDVSYTSPATWLKYAEMEMRHRFINHARNVWDRAVSLLPRVDQLWCARMRALCHRCLLHDPDVDRLLACIPDS